MNVRTLALTAALAAAGSALVTAPAVAGGAAVATSDEVVAYSGFPAGATARVHSASTPSGRTVVTLTVTGMEPGRTYGAHAHVNPCGMTGAAAGPHWQLADDPVKPSVDPAYANPANEVWLDVTTNASGNGTSTATLDVAFPADDRPRSVILHAEPTRTGAGQAGVAGARLACLTVGF